MRAAFLVVLMTGLTVGCTSSRYDRYDRSGRAYPASARVESRGGQTRYVICHKNKNTRTLPESAVRAHLDHGDRFGACGRNGRRDRDARGRDDDRDDRKDRRQRRGRGNGRGN